MAKRERILTTLNLVILKSIESLVVGMCKGCSTYEIIPEIRKHGYKRDSYCVAQRLVRMRDAGYVKSLPVTRFQLWSLTPKGYACLKQRSKN